MPSLEASQAGPHHNASVHPMPTLESPYTAPVPTSTPEQEVQRCTSHPRPKPRFHPPPPWPSGRAFTTDGKSTPHRLNSLHSSVHTQDTITGSGRLGQNTGNDKDKGIFYLFHQSLTIEGARHHEHELTLEATDQVDGDEPVRASTLQDFDLGIAVGPDQRALVWLRGVSLHTTGSDRNPRSIWPTRLDLGVTPIDDPTAVRVQAHLHIVHADSPDPIKEQENLPCHHLATLHLTVLIVPAAQVASDELSPHACMTRKRKLHDGVGDGAFMHAHAPDLACVVAPMGISLDLTDADPRLPPGRYLQTVAWSLEQETWSNGTMVRWQAGVHARPPVAQSTYDAGLPIRVITLRRARVRDATDAIHTIVHAGGHRQAHEVQEGTLDLFVPPPAGSGGIELETPSTLTKGGWRRTPPRGPRPPRGSLAGAATVPLDLPDRISMAGHSIIARRGSNLPPDPLVVRALYLEDPLGHATAFVVCDLWSASRYLHEQVAEETRKLPCALDVHEIVLLGTHTHNAPGGYCGNSLFDSMASAEGGFRPQVAEAIVAAIVAAIQTAYARAVPATVSFSTRDLWGTAWNRSLEAFQANEIDWSDLSHPGRSAPPGLDPRQRAIDPRVRVMNVWSSGGRHIAALATFGCHNTAIGAPGPSTSFYTSDWTGRAARLIEGAKGGAECALIGLSAAGDVTPMPLDGSHPTGLALVDRVGRAVAAAVLDAAEPPSAPAPIRLTGWFEDWEPAKGALPGNARTRLAAWSSGVPALGGAEDARSWLYPLAASEGMTGDHFDPADPQHPKVPALGFLGALIRGFGILKPSPVHPLHIIGVNEHMFATVPGEPTVMAAWQIERMLRRATGAEGISVLGYAGDYAGYFSTTEEFKRQHYEGASTLYGRESTNHLAVRLVRLTRGPAWRRPKVLTWGFSVADVEDPRPMHVPLAQQAILLPRGLRLLQVWDAADAPQAAPSAMLWRVHQGRRVDTGAVARVWSTQEVAPAGARVMWIAEWDLAEETAGLGWLVQLAPQGDHRADVVAINTTVPPEAPPESVPGLESPSPVDGSALAEQRATIEQLLAERPDAVGYALAEMIPGHEVHSYDEAVRLAERLAPALLGQPLPFEEGLLDAQPLPEGFTFPGYDPETIPVDPSLRVLRRHVQLHRARRRHVPHQHHARRSAPRPW